MSRNIQEYTAQYVADYGFEKWMVRYRQRNLLERLQDLRPASVIEIGCGSELLADSYYRSGGSWSSWVIVEPSTIFANHARNSGLPNLVVAEGMFEEVFAGLAQAPDFVVCSGLLHEVADAGLLLKCISEVMVNKTTLHVNVPSATSMHRRLALAMGIIPDLHNLSQRNAYLQQYRVFDMQSLRELIENFGMQISLSGGYLVKPFTHSQMESISGVLSEDILDGLYNLGRENPEWASEIFCEARLL